MTIHNQSITDTTLLDLRALIQKYGPPNFTTKRNPVGTLNEVFWSAFLAELNEIIFENLEDRFYRYDGRIYGTVTPHVLLDQLTNDIMLFAKERGYEPLRPADPHIADVEQARKILTTAARQLLADLQNFPEKVTRLGLEVRRGVAVHRPKLPAVGFLTLSKSERRIGAMAT